MAEKILLVAESINNKITATSRELTGLASQITSRNPGEVVFLVAGDNIEGGAQELAQQTGIDVRALEHPDFQYPNPEAMAAAVCSLTEELSADLICFLHTAAGCQAAAQTAVKLKTACITAVENLFFDDENQIVFQRALCNGKLRLKIKPATPRTVITVLPGAFKAEEYSQTPGKVTKIHFYPTKDTPACKPVSLSRSTDSDDAALEKADIVVAVGRGIGSEENLDIIHQTARALPNAAVAASRPLCDLKWLPYSRQVGATGKTVAPKLYLACGISGAQQHLQGMKESQLIVAINTDPNAAIFSHADYCIVEDITTFLPLLVKKYKAVTI